MRAVKSIFVLTVMSLAMGFQGAVAGEHPVVNAGAELCGKWELTEASAGMPKGTVWDFRKDGTLALTMTINGKTSNASFKYELQGKTLFAMLPDGTKKSTAVEKLTATELVFRDYDGLTATFHRAANSQGAVAPTNPVGTPVANPVVNLAGTAFSGSENIGAGYGSLKFEFQANGKVVMIDARNRINGTYGVKGNAVAINIPGACTYVGTINGDSFVGLGQDNTRTWNFTLKKDA